MEPVEYLTTHYEIDMSQKRPVEIPNVGRDMLGHWFREFGYTVGAEIGVERGIFSSVILKAHPDLEYYCIDSWQSYRGYNAKINGPDLERKFEEAQQRLAKFKNVHFVKKFSMEAVKDFADNSLDFVYIDANHDLPWCMDDIVYWSEKVRHGGIVAGHDYIRRQVGAQTVVRVPDALKWYTQLKPIPLWFVIGRQAKIPGEIRDNDRSWMWVKE